MKRLLLILGIFLLLAGQGWAAEWYRQGVVLSPSAADYASDILWYGEPNVIYDTNPQILTNQTSVFKMWFSAGGTAKNQIYYAESADGKHWTKYVSNPVYADYNECSVVKNGSTYYMYCKNADATLHRLTSSNGLTWTDTGTVLSVSGSETAIHNNFVWVEGSTWYMMYDATIAGVYTQNLATSSDGISWNKSASNPVIDLSPDTIGGPHVAKVGSNYYLWGQVAIAGTTPTDIYRYHSANLTSWTQDCGGIAFPRYSGDEGVGFAGGQVADPTIVQVNGQTYMYYGAYQNQSNNCACIKLAIANETIADLVATNEGRASGDPTGVAVASGSVILVNNSATGLKLSTVNGSAFVDFGVANSLTPYVGYKLVITDSAGKTLTGYIQAAGTGETYGANLVIDGDMETVPDVEWVTKGANTVDQSTTQAHSPTHSTHWPISGIYQGAMNTTTFATTGGACYVLDIWYWTTAANGQNISWGAVGLGENMSGQAQDALSQWVHNTLYRTAAGSAGTYFQVDSFINFGGDSYMDDVSVKRVLTPSTTGVTIVSYFGGQTRNWNYMESGFNIQDETGYTYAIYPGDFYYKLNIPSITTSYWIADGANVSGLAGVYVEGAGQTLQNIDAVRCPAGGFVFMETATLTNSIGISTGNDIAITAGKTVTGTYNLFGDASRAGTGTYSDGGSTTLWNSNPLFRSTSNFNLQYGSPALNTGTTIAGLSSDYAGNPVPWAGRVNRGAYNNQYFSGGISPGLGLTGGNRRPQ